jgi:hypothetical protein
MSYDYLAGIQGDFQFFDGIEVVSYERRDITSGASTTYTGVSALKRQTMGGLIEAGKAQATQQTASWHIDAATLPVTPRRGDRIISTTGIWEVLSGTTQTFGTRHVCETKKV